MNNYLPPIQELKAYGYNDVEARFLHLVCLHSGVFLARQFNQFAETKGGKRIDSFVTKLKGNRHCRTHKLDKNAAVFHLTSKAIYRAIGHENLRHRRSHRIDYVKTKLITLDYVLQNPNQKYLPTEEEKIHLFSKVLKVPVSDLPAKAYKTPNSKTATLRYFVDKFPLFLSGNSHPRPVVHFSYVDPGPYTSIVDFMNHLRLYSRLFARLDDIRLLYIYQISNKRERAEELFYSLARSGWEVESEDLEKLKYFRLREAWEAKEYEKVDPGELLFLNQARKKFAEARYEALYQQWKVGNGSSLDGALDRRKTAPKASFTTYKIEETYAPFGDLD